MCTRVNTHLDSIAEYICILIAKTSSGHFKAIFFYYSSIFKVQIMLSFDLKQTEKLVFDFLFDLQTGQ